MYCKHTSCNTFIFQQNASTQSEKEAMAAEVRKNEEEIERLRLAEQEVLEQTDEWKAKVKIYFLQCPSFSSILFSKFYAGLLDFKA